MRWRWMKQRFESCLLSRETSIYTVKKQSVSAGRAE